MKKKLYIIIISLLLLFLSGCDAILDSVYPPDVQNSIEVELNLDSSINYDYVKIQLVRVNEDSDLDLNSKITHKLWTSEVIYDFFSELPANEYRAFAFVDENDDDIPDWDEPSTELWNESDYSQPGLFDFRFNEEDLQYNAYGYINDYAGIGQHWLEQLNEGSDQGAYFDPNFVINGPEFLTTDVSGNKIFNIQRNDNSLNAVAHIRFFDSIGEIFFNDYNYDYATNQLRVNFDSTSTFFVDKEKLKIQIELVVNSGGQEIRKSNSFYVTFNTVELGFELWNGPGSVNKETEFLSVLNYDIIPINPNKVVQQVDWRITDSIGTSIAYDNNYDWNTSNVVYSGDGYISIYLADLDPGFDNVFWTDAYFIIKMIVYYDDGSSAEDFFYIGLN